MAYVMKYTWVIKWVGPNGLGMNAVQNLTGAVGPTQGQQLAFFDAGAAGSNTFTSTDITNLVATATTDMTTQLTAQQTRVQGFASGGS